MAQDPSDEPLNEDPEEYVGYCHPPARHKWAKGYCPNPAGRPKSAQGRRPILQRLAMELIEVRVGGSVRRMPRLEVLLLAVRNATANGDPMGQKLYNKLLGEVPDDERDVAKGVLILPEKLSQEMWEIQYRYTDGRPLGMPPAWRVCPR
ncbi:DUF5681 domain-containing protein [Sphingomonas arvum]|uniref:DUF5681 domain-containing protein n=1 Tax=Sphingomonas arvum TaxID=2992113 RepID=UPI0038B309E7